MHQSVIKVTGWNLKVISLRIPLQSIQTAIKVTIQNNIINKRF